MKLIYKALWILFGIMNGVAHASDRISEARKIYHPCIDSLFDSLGIEYLPAQVLITDYKKEQILQLWAKSKSNTILSLAREYKFTAYCGALGPKRKRGDLQIPEGFYHINCFNPRCGHSGRILNRVIMFLWSKNIRLNLMSTVKVNMFMSDFVFFYDSIHWHLCC